MALWSNLLCGSAITLLVLAAFLAWRIGRRTTALIALVLAVLSVLAWGRSWLVPVSVVGWPLLFWFNRREARAAKAGDKK